jgi:molybdopterin molybdotransferase
MLAFEDARRKVIEIVSGLKAGVANESLALGEALGRVLAQTVHADRDYPPFDRATRDGFAVRAEDISASSGELVMIGEIRAGQAFSGSIARGECVQIMTGAAVPASANAVMMIEYTRAEHRGEKTIVHFDRGATTGQNVVPRGSEARSGQLLMRPGQRLGYSELALCGQVGQTKVRVSQRPRIAILSTGDEVVSADSTPGPLEIRNGNSISLAAQVRLAGGEPVELGNAPDRAPELKAAIEEGLKADALVISGGVSAGKYDLVEQVLAELGAEIYFDGVAIRPGRPAVFGVCRNKPVFGLPGNPVSTMVTFELFLLPTLDILSGAQVRPLAMLRAKLGAPVIQKSDLTHFLPAKLEWPTGETSNPIVRELEWRGSGDIVTLAESNCFLVVPQKKLEWQAGEWIGVLPRRGSL